MPDERQDGPFDYQLFGLAVRSEFELPELPIGKIEGDPDVGIRRGMSDGTRIQIDGVAEFSVADGSNIWVSPAPGAASRNVRLYLLGSAMGLLLHHWRPLIRSSRMNETTSMTTAMAVVPA